MKKLLLMAMLLATLPALAQYNPGILIILNNGDSIRSNYVGINNTANLFRGPHISLHPEDKKQRLSIEEIKSIEGFDSQTQTHRYFRKLNYPHNNVLAERSINSKHIQAYYFDSYYQSGMYGGGYSWRHLYYIKDNAPLKKATYANLKNDLSDSPEALAHLKKANSMRITQYAMYVVGAGILVAAVNSLSNAPMGPEAVGNETNTGLALGLVGIVTLSIPYYLNSPKQNHMTNALKAY